MQVLAVMECRLIVHVSTNHHLVDRLDFNLYTVEVPRAAVNYDQHVIKLNTTLSPNLNIGVCQIFYSIPHLWTNSSLINSAKNTGLEWCR